LYDLVFTNGCFDIIHRGHIDLLQYCKSIGNRVIVGLNSDESVKQLKGPTRPFFKQEDRKRVLEALKFVDEVAIFNQPTPYELIKKLGPNIIVKGGDYIPEQVIGNDLCEVRIFNYLDGYSTTSILNNITKEN
jgi:D-beta-D-heptose 7-phosphate kinase/D-beta-D-heptose 1-phosphate adenosyltransferase